MTVHSFFECFLCVTYINSVIHGAFYFIDNTFIPTFTFVNAFSVDFGWKRTVTFSIHEVTGKDSPTDFHDEVSVCTKNQQQKQNKQQQGVKYFGNQSSQVVMYRVCRSCIGSRGGQQ